ncbi:MAG: hypothetical protein HQ542_02090, partial [Bacteroidia bacterium]|nr:hypothetical protein [Bacteroidia bacterium]
MVRVTSLLLLFFHLLSWNSKAIEPDRGSLSVPVSIQVNLTCCGEILKGSFVQMQHAIFPDTVYAAVTDSTGLAGFPAVHQGLYSIVIKRFCYHPLTTVAVFTGPDTLSYTLNQVKKPIWGLTVHESTLLARWNPPRIDSVLLDEDWISGGFTANQWTVTGGSNWLVHPNNGHPRPAALFSWTPVVTNYEQFLTSRTIPAIHSNQLTLTYEIQLANFSPGQN